MVWDLRGGSIIKISLDPFAEEADSEGGSKIRPAITGFAVPQKYSPA